MTKLTNGMRSAIVAQSLRQGREQRESVLKTRERSLACRLTIHRYGEDVFRKCRALPEGWLNTLRTISFTDYPQHNILNFPVKVIYEPTRTKFGRRVERTRIPYQHKLELDTAVPLPNSFQHRWEREHLGDMYNEVYDHFASMVALADEEEQIRTQMKGALMSFTTVEKLRDGWPEAFAALPQELLVATPMANRALPVPRLDDLNARLEAFRSAA